MEITEILHKKKVALGIEKEIVCEKISEYKERIKQLRSEKESIGDKLNAIYFQEIKHDTLMRGGVKDE